MSEIVSVDDDCNGFRKMPSKMRCLKKGGTQIFPKIIHCGGFIMFRNLVFISILLLLAGLSDIGREAKAEKAPATLELGPMLGYTGPGEAHIWLKASSAARSGIIIGEAVDLRDGQTVKGPELTSETEYMGVVEVAGLRPATRYFYKTVLDGQVNPKPPFSLTQHPPKTPEIASASLLSLVLGISRNTYSNGERPLYKHGNRWHVFLLIFSYNWVTMFTPARRSLIYSVASTIGTADFQLSKKSWRSHQHWRFGMIGIMRTTTATERLLGKNGHYVPLKSCGPIRLTAKPPIPVSISSSPGATWISSCLTFVTIGPLTTRKMKDKKRCWGRHN